MDGPKQKLSRPKICHDRTELPRRAELGRENLNSLVFSAQCDKMSYLRKINCIKHKK